jgi:hypothetical protein
LLVCRARNTFVVLSVHGDFLFVKAHVLTCVKLQGIICIDTRKDVSL